MNELDRWLARIERKYSALDEESKKELVALLKSLDNYLATQPSYRKLRSIRVLVSKKMRKEAVEPFGVRWYNTTEIQKLRDEIVHGRPIEGVALLSFGRQMWKEIAEWYSDNAVALYNTLVYVIQPKDIPELEFRNSAKSVESYFKEIYESKSDAEKIAIVRNLIPLVVPKFKERSSRLNAKRTMKHENTFQENQGRL